MSDRAIQFLSDLVVYNKYSNFLPEQGRRQTWNENVTEVREMHKRKYPHLSDLIDSAFEYVYDKKVLPSMRSIQYGGRPIEMNPCRIYNCSYSPIETAFVFSEIFFELLSGTGTGYSVRMRHVTKLPPIVSPQGERRFLIGDSMEGWADSIRQLIYAYMKGRERPRFDYADIRPAGAPIKSGGRSAGHEKLKVAHQKIEAVLKQAIGRRLYDIECHDIICYMADCVLAGGRRDSAMIALFDITSTDMIKCKTDFNVVDYEYVADYSEGDDHGRVYSITLSKDGAYCNPYGEDMQNVKVSMKYGSWDVDNLEKNLKISWFYIHPQRGRANNSIALRRGQVKKKQFMDVFKYIKEYGEPAFVWTDDDDSGVNPCAEIALNPYQFCNLTSVNVFDVESQDELNDRVWAAALIGTLQAGYTDFHYIRHIWKETTEREALLGISMTGVASGKVLGLDLREAAMVGVATNKDIAKQIGIKSAARVTTMKPEGTGTWAVKAVGSGIHAAHGKYFVRTVRINKSEPLYEYLLSKMPEFVETDLQNSSKAVISVPVKAPDGVITRDESAFDLLERVKRFSLEWVHEGHVSGVNKHNVSATISVRPDEWDGVAEWMWENRSIYSGLSLLPYSGGNYKQAPFIEVDEVEYDELMAKFPTDVDLTEIQETESLVNHASDNLACAGGACEIK